MLAIGEHVAAVAIAPDGKRAFAVKFPNHKVAMLEIARQKVTYTKSDMPVGLDLEATPPRVIDRVVVGEAPEGFAISPTGEIAVAILLNGNGGAKNAWFYNRNGRVAVLKIDSKKVSKVGEVEVRGLPEPAVFSPDGKYLYVGNFLDQDISILKVDGTTVTDTGKRLALPGHPASMRGRNP